MTPDDDHDVGAEVDDISSAVEAYLRETKGWSPDQFRLEVKQVDPDAGAIVIWAIFAEDERSPVPGGGRSVELLVDPASGEVLSELRFQ